MNEVGKCALLGALTSFWMGGSPEEQQVSGLLSLRRQERSILIIIL